jgi:hypothetical protein
MCEVLTQENGLGLELKYRIDGNGTVIFDLPSSGVIRDAGKEIHFGSHDKSAKETALKYAQKRWELRLNCPPPKESSSGGITAIIWKTIMLSQ